MTERKTAFFIGNARRLADLRVIHPIDAEEPYEIVKTVRLSNIDYENFTTDLLADRAFLDGFPETKWNETVHHCVFVHRRGQEDGVLVVPTADGHVKLAAYAAER